MAFLLEIGDILKPSFMAVDLYDEFLERKGRDLTREVFAINLYDPARVSGIGESKLRGIPATRIEDRSWGAIVVRATDRLSIAEDPQARQEILKALWA